MSFEQLFEASFRAHFHSVHRYAYALLRSHAQASDAVQSVFVKWWEAKTPVNGLTEAKRYLYAAVYRTSLNVIRDEKSKKAQAESFRLTVSGRQDFNDMLEVSELNNAIQTTINSLPQQCRTIFTLSRSEGKKYAEIATEMNLSVKTVETQMGKALRILRERLATYITDEQHR